MRIVELAASATHDIRRRMLRGGDPDAEVVFAGDEDPATVHMGAVLDQTGSIAREVSRDAAGLVAVSSWYPGRTGPVLDAVSEHVWQLRGMAVLAAWQGCGIGSAMLLEAFDALRARGGVAVWARARDTALGFYLAHGFVGVGEGYRDDTTGLAHHDMWRSLGASPDGS